MVANNDDIKWDKIHIECVKSMIEKHCSKKNSYGKGYYDICVIGHQMFKSTDSTASRQYLKHSDIIEYLDQLKHRIGKQNA